MAMTIKPGTRLFSAVCTAEFIAVKAPASEVDVTIGGYAPVSSAAERPEGGRPLAGHDAGSVMGKRYVDDDETIELLCTKPGPGSLALGGTLLHPKDAKPLPSSD